MIASATNVNFRCNGMREARVINLPSSVCSVCRMHSASIECLRRWKCSGRYRAMSTTPGSSSPFAVPPSLCQIMCRIIQTDLPRGVRFIQAPSLWLTRRLQPEERTGSVRHLSLGARLANPTIARCEVGRLFGPQGFNLNRCNHAEAIHYWRAAARSGGHGVTGPGQTG